MRLISALILLLLTCPVFSQESGPDLGIPAELRPMGQYATLQPKTDAKTITYIGKSGIDPLPSAFLADKRWFLLDTRGLPQGIYSFEAVGSLDDVHTRFPFVVIVGSPPPGPTPPGPTPGPGPSPVPPGPGPAPAPFPTIAEGLRVLIVWEDEDRARLPREQLLAITGEKLTTHLNTNCAKDTKGRADWHIYDDDYEESEIGRMAEYWRKPYRDSVKYFREVNVPVIIVTNSKLTTEPKGELTKLPKVEPEIISLVDKYLPRLKVHVRPGGM